MPHIINPASGSIHTFLNTASGSHSAIDIALRIPGWFLFVFKFTYSSPFIVLFIHFASPELQLVSENALEVYINATLQLTAIAELANQSTPGH